MRNCPNCNEILGNNVDVCFRCGYDFKRLQEIRIEEFEQINAEKEETISKNPVYEYRTEYLMDDASGILNKRNLDSVLTRYAIDGWRLHTMVVNEAGKNSTTVGIGGISSGTNATMDVTILVFERCVKAGEL